MNTITATSFEELIDRLFRTEDEAEIGEGVAV